jgi:chromosome segregation ATPase
VRELQAIWRRATGTSAQLQDQLHAHSEESAALRGELEAFQSQMQAEEQRARAELDEAMAREGQARKALETKLAERSQQLQRLRSPRPRRSRRASLAAERVKALERQLQAEVEKRTQTEAKGRRDASACSAAQLQAALGDEEETRKGLEQKLQALTRELEAARSGEEKAGPRPRRWRPRCRSSRTR